MGSAIDETGNTYTYLRVVKQVGHNKGGQFRWLCRCKCGKETIVTGGNLRTGSVKSCGCLKSKSRNYPFLNLKGKKFGRLTVLKRNGSSKWHNVLWLCKCECGNITTVQGTSLDRGLTKSCGCLQRIAKGEAAFNSLFAQTRLRAEAHGREFRLTKEQVRRLSKKPCNYCGAEPYQVIRRNNGNYIYSGLDRIDNSNGYTIDNVVPCCVICNRSKMTLKVDEFLRWIRNVHKHSIDRVR